MNSIVIEIFLIFLLIILNGLLALSEIALVAAKRTKLEQLAKEGSSRAHIALQLANSPDSFLSTVQIGITFVGILAGAFGGATIAELLARYFAAFPLLAPYSETIGVAIIVIFITYLSVIIGELIPKRLALNNPENISLLVAPLIHRLSQLARPLVILLSGSTNLLLRIFRFKTSPEPAVTEEEIKLLIDKGTQDGTFQEFEQDTIERVFRLADRRVAVLMTPRADIVWLDLNESEDETKHKIAQYRYSAYPVAEDTLDNVVGIVKGKELLSLAMEEKPLDLKKTSRKPLFVLETTPAVKVMELFKKSKMNVGFVVDEYGTIQGLVTFGDILHSVFEDVEDEVEGEKDIVKREDGSLLISGSLPLDEFLDYMEIAGLSDKEHAGINTVGGFVMAKLEAVPLEGHYFVWEGLRIEVVDMDGRRVDKILVSRVNDDKKDTEVQDEKNS